MNLFNAIPRSVPFNLPVSPWLIALVVWPVSQLQANEMLERINKQGLVQDRLQIRQGAGDPQNVEVFKHFNSFTDLANRVEAIFGKDYLVRRYESESYKSLIISDQKQNPALAFNTNPPNLSPAEVAALLQDKVYVISFIPTGAGGHTILGSNLQPVFASLNPSPAKKLNSELFASAPFLRECQDPAESEIIVAQTYNGSLQCRFDAKKKDELNIQIASWLAKQGYEQISLNSDAASQQGVYRAKAGHSVVNVLLNKAPDGNLHLIINEGISSAQGMQSPKHH